MRSHAKISLLSALVVSTMTSLNGLEAIGLQNGGKTNDKSKAIAASRSTGYSTAPIAMDINTLPANFHGNDPERVYKALENRNLRSVKGEYESTSEYLHRIARETLVPVIGQMNLDSVFAFEVPLDQTLYDADSQTLSLFLEADNTFLEEYRLSTVRQKLTNIDLGRHKMTNAFGASVLVRAIHSISFGLAFVPEGAFDTTHYIHRETENDIARDAVGIITKLRMDPQSALRSRNRIHALLVCKLISPYALAGETDVDAKVDSPYQIHAGRFYTVADILEIWFYDTSSGAILGKVKSKKLEH